MYKKILVPLDGSELAECVLPHVASIAKGCGVESVVFLRIVEPFYMPSGGDSTVFSEEDIKRISSERNVATENYLSQDHHKQIEVFSEHQTSSHPKCESQDLNFPMSNPADAHIFSSLK